MRKMSLVVVILLVLSFVLLVPIAPRNTINAITVDDARELFNLINSYRVQKGYRQILWADDIFVVAYNHSVNMHNKGKLTHTLDGKDPEDRLKDASIGYTCYVENVAFNSGYENPVQQAFDQWKNSTGHNKNMLSDCAVFGAVGVASSSKGNYFTYLALTRDSSGGGGQQVTDRQKAAEFSVVLKPGQQSDQNNINWKNDNNFNLEIAWRVEYQDTMTGWLKVQPSSVVIPPNGTKSFGYYMIANNSQVGTSKANLVFVYVGNEYIQPLRLTVIPTDVSKMIELWIGSLDFAIDGVVTKLDAAPFIKLGRTVVPVRAISEGFGASVDWNGAERKVTVTSTGVVLEMWINSTTVKVNGVSQTIDAAPIISNGRTFVPFRFIAEAFGAEVSWDAYQKKVMLIQR